MNKIYHKYEYWVNTNNRQSGSSAGQKQKSKQKTEANKKENKQDKQKTQQDKSRQSQQNKKEGEQNKQKKKESEKDKQKTKQNKEEGEQNKQESKQNKTKKGNKNYPNEYYSYCKYLGLESDFTREQLKNKYRELMKIFHPDLYQNNSKEDTLLVENKSKEINIAYEYLNKYVKKEK
jgi:hypothetical protein